MVSVIHLVLSSVVFQGVLSENRDGVHHLSARTLEACESSCLTTEWCEDWAFEDRCILHTAHNQVSHEAFGVDHKQLLQVDACPPEPGFDYYDEVCMALVPLTLEDGCTVSYPNPESCWTICDPPCHKFEYPCHQTCSEPTCIPGTDCCDDDGLPLPPGTNCGDGETECSAQDTCDGFGVCEIHDYPFNFPCGDPSSSECDDPDSCNGAGLCMDRNLNGSPCGDPTDGLCDLADSCRAGVCETNLVAADDPCVGGDATDDTCTNPDTCDGAGVCNSNDAPNGTECGDLSDSECDDPDSCQSGVCQDNHEAPGTACGDPTDNDCDNPDTCDASGVCQSNLELVGTSCGDQSDTECTDPDTCDGLGVCEDNHEPEYTICGNPVACNCFTGECQCECDFLTILPGYGDVHLKIVDTDFKVTVITNDDDRWHGIAFRENQVPATMANSDAYLIHTDNFNLMDTYLTTQLYDAVSLPQPDANQNAVQTYFGETDGHIVHSFTRPLNTGDPLDIVVPDVSEGQLFIAWSKGATAGAVDLAYHGANRAAESTGATFCKMDCDPSQFFPEFGELRVWIVDAEAVLHFVVVSEDDGEWVGVGVGAGMRGSPTYIAFGNGGDMMDYHNDAVDRVPPTLDPIQNILQCRNIAIDGKRIIEFEIPLNSGDPNDPVIDPAANELDIIWARGATEDLQIAGHLHRATEIGVPLCHR